MVRKQLNRFVIPFFFSPERYEQLYAKIEARQIQVRTGIVPFWQVRRLLKGENEFFPFLNDSLDPDRPQNVGTLWRPNPKWQPRGKVFYRSPNAKPDYLYCGLSIGGLSLFKTGVGFAWFDLVLSHYPNFPSGKGKRAPSVAQIMEVNNYCKDICHRHLDPQQQRFRFFPGWVYAEGELPLIPEDKQRGFSLFAWLWENFFPGIEQVEFFSPNFSQAVPDSPVPLPELGPNKSHVFTALYLDPEEERTSFQELFWLRKGYRPSYLPPESALSEESPEVLRLFQNMICGVCFEGCALLSYYTGQEKTDLFFQSSWDHTMENYFLLYLIALQQHYTLLHLSAQMAQLPSRLTRFGPQEHRRLLDIQEELGLAYTKSFFPQVSYIGHQNTAYDRFCEVLRISRLQEDLAQRTAVLSELLQSYRSRKRERFSRTLTVTGGIFVVLQTLNNVLGIYDLTPPLAFLGRWGFSGAIMLISLLLGYGLTVFWNRKDGM